MESWIPILISAQSSGSAASSASAAAAAAPVTANRYIMLAGGYPTDGTTKVVEVIDTQDFSKTCPDLPDLPDTAGWGYPSGGLINDKPTYCGGLTTG